VLEFQIPNMTCGHCVRAVTEAVHAADAAAQVTVNLPQHQVLVQTQVPRERVVAQLAQAGYVPA
jgi:copper chaperone